MDGPRCRILATCMLRSSRPVPKSISVPNLCDLSRSLSKEFLFDAVYECESIAIALSLVAEWDACPERCEGTALFA